MAYSDIRSVQILIALLKEYEICDVILSPGGSDIPLIHSVEMDDFFTCYSVVDERSAAYFAMGVAQEKNKPVACICTSGTAVCNYVPGITEAYYQNVPVLAITADKNPYFQGQLEIQKINQTNIFTDVIKKSVDLPWIRGLEDEWLCNRLVNEALLELTHHGWGPVQINIPIIGPTNFYNCLKLPKERKISIVDNPIWENISHELKNKKIMVVVGQNVNFSDLDIQNMNSFYEKYNCIFAVENLSNLDCKGVINSYPITEMYSQSKLSHLLPDIVISLGNNLAAYNLKPFLRNNYKKIDNWLVSEDGKVRDAYKALTTIFEISSSRFFESLAKIKMDSECNGHSYFGCWEKEINSIKLPEFDFSNFYVAQSLAKIIPADSILHTAILNSTRIMQFFSLAKNVRNYSNVGGLGIDGCFSTFVGQASASPNKLSFLLIGDLSFFYDMNAAGLRSIHSNVRIILLNNGGGSEFHFFMGKKNISTLNKYICAEHDNSAAGWIKSLGYDYYSASTKEEFDNIIKRFGEPSDKPLFLEIFTDMERDAEYTNELYDRYRKDRTSNKEKTKKILAGFLSQKQKEKAKKILNILKEE
ncbi:thiamine pyrophosphate-binding protein [uncultured Dubosiella sp.]|uniref:2-succinyl-5-enolpyruvyl-6-hydroxy-3- cyclohexene-1-carboxylate synthase n=1 Tax=uncultured Dubosiella sp. TaxID=1937011 RepID=UPI0032B249C2